MLHPGQVLASATALFNFFLVPRKDGVVSTSKHGQTDLILTGKINFGRMDILRSYVK